MAEEHDQGPHYIPELDPEKNPNYLREMDKDVFMMYLFQMVVLGLIVILLGVFVEKKLLVILGTIGVILGCFGFLYTHFKENT